MTRVLTWISIIWIPLGLVPLAWMTLLAAGYCEFDCGTLGTWAINGLIASCVLLLLAWLIVLVAMIRRRVGRRTAIMAGLADLLLLVLVGISLWTFAGV